MPELRRAMSHPSRIEQITRSLAYMLRHKPEEFDLELDRFGAADCGEVIQALNERLGEPIEEEDLHDAIGSGDRIRYDIKNGRIRALYGHSIEVDPGEPCKPPELLYVGLGSRDAERAEHHGLRAGRRRFLHLARTFEEAHETGRHQARSYAVITIYALDAWEQGINFYDRISLYLSEPIPTEFLEVGEVHHDGHPPVERPGRERRPRERDHSEGRGRERGRRPERRGDRRPDSEESGRSGSSRRQGGSRGDRPGRGDREESRPRESRDPRSERGERPQRSDRPDRGDRPDRPRRSERPERPERRSRPEPAERASTSKPERVERETVKHPRGREEAAPSASNFGAGLFEAPEPSAPEPVVHEAPVPEPEPARQPEREPERAPDPPSGPGFGAGV